MAIVQSRRFVDDAIRLPILGLLVILEPAMTLLCSTVLVLGLITTAIFALSSAAAEVPIWAMLATSLSAGALLVLYQALIARLS